MIGRLNRWYDGVREPWRFLLAMGLSMAGIVALSYGSFAVRVAAAAYLGMLLYVRVKGRYDAAA